MPSRSSSTRRWFVQGCLAAGSTAALLKASAGPAADAPLLSPQDPAAKKLQYTEAAVKVPQAGGHTCADCALYEGKYGSAQGPCQLFVGRQVKAAGWCSSWAPQL